LLSDFAEKPTDTSFRRCLGVGPVRSTPLGVDWALKVDAT
jgi:hypothetical protein